MTEFFTNLYEQGMEWLGNNQFASGGAMLMVLGSGLYLLRALPMKALSGIKRLTVRELEILDQDPAYDWVAKWLANHDYTIKRARRLTAVTGSGADLVFGSAGNHRTSAVVGRVGVPDDPGESDTRPQIYYFPAPGWHLIRYSGSWVLIHRERESGDSGGNGGGSKARFRETLTLRTVCRDRTKLPRLIEEARELALPRDDARPDLYRGMHYGDWAWCHKLPPRRAESVILPSGLFEDLAADARWFLDAEDWYADRGIPWRRGYLLHGPPGNGKTSLVVALASALSMKVGIINLRSSLMSDDDLASLFRQREARGMIVVLEDVDCLFEQRKKSDPDSSDDQKVTFSGFLNSLDGIASGEGRIVIMTTNHPEKLDRALYRPGRVDRVLEIGTPGAQEILRMYHRFYPGHMLTGEPRRLFLEPWPVGKVSMAHVQRYFQQYPHDPEKAADPASVRAFVETLDDWAFGGESGDKPSSLQVA